MFFSSGEFLVLSLSALKLILNFKIWSEGLSTSAISQPVTSASMRLLAIVKSMLLSTLVL